MCEITRSTTRSLWGTARELIKLHDSKSQRVSNFGRKLLETLRAFRMPSIWKRRWRNYPNLCGSHLRKSCSQVIPRVPTGRDLVLGLSSEQINDTESDSLPDWNESWKTSAPVKIAFFEVLCFPGAAPTKQISVAFLFSGTCHGIRVSRFKRGSKPRTRPVLLAMPQHPLCEAGTKRKMPCTSQSPTMQIVCLPVGAIHWFKFTDF